VGSSKWLETPNALDVEKMNDNVKCILCRIMQMWLVYFSLDDYITSLWGRVWWDGIIAFVQSWWVTSHILERRVQCSYDDNNYRLKISHWCTHGLWVHEISQLSTLWFCPVISYDLLSRNTAWAGWSQEKVSPLMTSYYLHP